MRQKKLFQGRFLEVRVIPLTGMQTHTKEKNYTGNKDTGHGIPEILETLQCYYFQPKVD
jgi:hypothetical protein